MAAATRRVARTGRHRVPGLLSIVVPVYQVERYVDDCLTSLRRQTYRKTEIVVVDDGSRDASMAIVAGHARRDPCIRVVHRANGGLSAARNTGAEAARGAYLTFVDSDDMVSDPELYAQVIATLEETGSDLAVTGYDRWEDGSRRDAAPWIRAVHDRERRRTTLRDFPEVQANAVAWSKVYRRAFYDETALHFPEGALFEDQPVSSRAYARARSFDVLPLMGVTWRVREDRTSISQQAMSLRNVIAHTAAVEASFAELAEAAPYAVAPRASQLLRHNMWFFTRQLPIAEDGVFEVLSQSIGLLLSRVDPEEYADNTAPYDKALNLFVARGDRARTEALLAAGREAGHYPVVREDGDLRCLLPMHDDPGSGLGPQELRLGDRLLTLRSGVDRVRWSGHVLEIEGWAFVRFVDMASSTPRLELAATAPDGRLVPLEVTTFTSPRLDEVSSHAYCDYRPGGFRAALDIRTLPPTVDRWTFALTLDVDGVRRTGPLTGVASFGSATLARHSPSGTPPYVSRSLDGLLVLDRTTVEGNKAAPERPAEVTGFAVDADRVVVEVAGDDLDVGEATGVLVRQGVELRARAEAGVPGTLRLSFATSRDDDRSLRGTAAGPVEPPPGVYRLLLQRSPDGPARLATLSARVLDLLPSTSTTGAHQVRFGVGRKGGLTVRLHPPLAPDEVGARTQRLLRETTLGRHPVIDQVFLRAPSGRSADLWAVHDALSGRTSAVTWWSVPDLSAPVPAGACVVVEGTRQWYEAFTSSRVVVLDGPAEPWMTTTDDQRVVQVGVGYPLTPWGHDIQAAHHAPEALPAVDARVRDWDVVASPASFATTLLTTQVLAPARARARVLEVGSAHNDLVLSGRAQALRARTRAALGLSDSTLAVLHAPARRRWLTATDPATRELDPAKIAAALGPETVVLACGHAADDPAPLRGERTYDLTGADLTLLALASDAAVLDYSPLRFDYLLQDKPMVFLVPDLAQFALAHGFAVDESDTAPGPRATDLSTLEQAWRQATDPRYTAERHRVRADYLDREHGDAAARLATVVVELLEGGAPR
ncbi:CDP-glycerol glycerophosphotransferase family protein [Mumia sp. ZJ1417]|uniref:bifunctional glycosyltransferase/CDP-glycerol:glycerophosphate glycerophosphotransferase n=1 Tax=Mumia sp. ZJ1417 TaxID=2708082 RepID=UPI00141F3580|nr:CDP-glycerol glycerophosphotransferase family protein [Mumia sp. ZJ1417]QMW65926.1 CDP-glycerol glycerophosphotransferase family protein [Mumia sp. ZJ1417]